MKDLSNCPLCESSNVHTVRKYTFETDEVSKQKELPDSATYEQERLWIYFHHLRQNLSPAEVDVSMCEDCGFVFTNPRLTQAELARKYALISELGNDQEAHQRSKPPFIQERQNRIHQWLHKVWKTPPPRTWKVLDYGGAEGYLLQPFLEDGHEGYLCDYVAYELADSRIVFLGQDVDSIAKNASFDLIFCLHTLEHVADPIEITRKLAEKLSPEGALYIEVPLGAWLEWNDIREPITHVNYFSEQSLKYVLEAAGLEVIALESNWQYVTHAKHLCINILGRKTATDSSEVNRRTALSTKEQMRSFRYVPEALQINLRYYLKQWLRARL